MVDKRVHEYRPYSSDCHIAGQWTGVNCRRLQQQRHSFQRRIICFIQRDGDAILLGWSKHCSWRDTPIYFHKYTGCELHRVCNHKFVSVPQQLDSDQRSNRRCPWTLFIDWVTDYERPAMFHSRPRALSCGTQTKTARMSICPRLFVEFLQRAGKFGKLEFEPGFDEPFGRGATAGQRQ